MGGPEIEPPSPDTLRQLDEDPGFRALLLRQHRELSALTARHAQEYVRAVLVWRKHNS